jgi:hypothetical protein
MRNAEKTPKNKTQIPENNNLKIQTPKKQQITAPKNGLVFEAWNFSGVWFLGFVVCVTFAF